MLIDVIKVTKDFGFGELFNPISFSLNSQDRLALVGRNGCGKSTILKMISGKTSLTSGSVNISKNAKIAMLDQTSADVEDGRLVEEILKGPFKKFDDRQKLLDNMQAKMSALTGTELDKLIEKYSNALEQFVADGGYDVDQNINYVTGGLKIKHLMSHTYSNLSGGEKTLVQFAKILLDNPDVLLLDEPTNHLDIERIEWLEGYLQKFKGALIVVSHDRYFLDRVAKIVIDVEDGGERYAGNYSYFVKAKEDKELKEFEQYKNEQKKLEQLKSAVRRLYEWGERSDNPATFRRAKAIQKRIDEIEENGISKPKENKNLPINMIRSDRGSDIVFDVSDFSLILGDKILYDNAKFQMRAGDKIAIVGNNGTGKTSLIKCLMGECLDYMGNIKIGGSIKLGYLPQILHFDNDKETVLDYVKNNTELKEEGARRLLAKFFFFKSDVEKMVKSLSGGEKVRLKIACMLENEINTFIFDEPTNHIDIFTRETLEQAMKEFKGNILFVSHDRYFIDGVANKILEIKDCKLNLFAGNYSDYKNKDNIKLDEKPVKVKPIKPPKIYKGGK